MLHNIVYVIYDIQQSQKSQHGGCGRHGAYDGVGGGGVGGSFGGGGGGGGGSFGGWVADIFYQNKVTTGADGIYIFGARLKAAGGYLPTLSDRTKLAQGVCHFHARIQESYSHGSLCYKSDSILVLVMRLQVFHCELSHEQLYRLFVLG